MAEFEAKSREVADASQGCQPTYASVNPAQHSWPVMDDSAATSRNLSRVDALNGSGNSSTSGYHYGQHNEMVVSREASGAANHGSTTFGAPAAHDYSHHAPYSYPGYQNHYYAYQQQPANVSSQQQVASGQNTGAYHQPLSSFQNPSSYVGPTGYTGTYYNHGDYQTTSGYPSSGYVSQTHVWSGTNNGPYASYDYPKYTVPSTSSAQNANTAAEASLSYQHQYNQWASYYSQSAPSVPHAPEPENKQVTSASMGNPTPSICGGYTYGHNQPPPPGTTSWRQDFTSKLPCLQGKNEVSKCNQIDASADAIQQNYQANPTPSKGPNIHFSLNNQVFPNFQSPSQTVYGVDARQTSKIQIPTNPRIAPNLSINVVKNDKEMGATNATAKPAYISVSAPKTGNQVPTQDSAGSIPPSLRRYVEKTFARCKNDSQRAANQTIMKEMITKASADGTLLTQDWDAEPIFALPAFDDTTGKKSPSRRNKSRWEPVSEHNSEKLWAANGVPEKNAWNHYNNHVNVATAPMQSKEMPVAKKEVWNTVKFVPAEPKPMSPMSTPRPLKKPRHGDGNTESSDASSDSDKEQNLTRYYSSAIALMNSPEERKKREYRVKRFDIGTEHQTEVRQLQLRDVGAANLYARRTSALMLAKNEDSSNKAVEDIDWDSLTVKGTCQEIEKRYLRLTSAPDPATVRPEEVLEKALQMVQNSQKNYLYKCDQLKSIRQDLTVQRIRNELTVKVYETHARIALEAGDLAEYNQCQSQLKTLYAEGIEGCHLEFSAYNLLCVILHSNNREVLSSMARLSVEAKKDEAVKHALAVREAVTSGNYIMFFRLYKEAPNLNTCLMDLYVEKMRFAAVKCMCKSYRLTVPVAYVAQVLGFSKTVLDGKETDGHVECEYWLMSHGASLTSGANGEKHLDTKVSSSTLFMPEPEDAVAHGDASLAVDDFLTKAP